MRLALRAVTPRTVRGRLLVVVLGSLIGASHATAGLVPPGARDVAVVMVNFSGGPTSPWTPDQVRSAVFTGSGSANAFLQEESFGAISLRGRTRADGDVFGPVTITAPTNQCDPDTWATQASAGLALNGYQHRMYILPGVSACGWAGLADISGPISFINGTLSTRVVAHELGHNLGVHHARSLTCGSSGAGVAISGSCTASEYGDPFDVMGGSSRHSSALTKVRLGFIPAANELTVTRSGVYLLAPSSMPAGLPQSLRIRRGTGSEYWYFEIRRPTGMFDAFAVSDPAVTGVSVRLSQGAPAPASPTYIVDANPATSGAFADAPLGVGRSFTDVTVPSAPTVTVDSVEADGARMRVDFPGDPQPGATPAPPPIVPLAVSRATVTVRRVDARRGVVRVSFPTTARGKCSARIGSVGWIRCPIANKRLVATRGFRVRKATVAVAVRIDGTIIMNRRFAIPKVGAKRRLSRIPVRIAQ